MRKILAAILVMALSVTGATAQHSAGKLPINGSIETRIGTLEFSGGYPTEETAAKAFDQLDVQRATQAYLEFMALASQNSIFEAHIRDYGLKTPSDIQIYVEPGVGKAGAIGLTYNTESIYATAHIDLLRDGPTVVETPPNVLGIVDDGFMRWLTDIGNAGPDKGKGGKYLILPPSYDGDVPEGYFVVRAPTYRNWVMVRGFVEDTGTGQTALNYYRERFKIYPLASGPRADAQYTSISFAGGDTTHPRDIRYFELLQQIVDYEPASAFTPYQLGLLMALGIEKGKPFAPDARLRGLIDEGLVIGDAIAKANAYANRLDGVRRYDDRKYELLFVGGDHEFRAGPAINLDGRLLFHYEAIVVTPAMARKMVGIGSQYLSAYRDSAGTHLMGDHVYRLRLPAGIPAKDFWSITAYHPDTRSLLQNGMPKPSISSYDEPEANADGSVDIWFAPVPPQGHEKNWIKTLPGQGWSILLRLYGPLEPYFDDVWKPDDIVKVD